MPEAVLRLKKGTDRRLRGGHLWIYSNEVDIAATPLKGMVPGSSVVVEDARGKPLGAATVNPASLICARLYSRQSNRELDTSLLVDRLKTALIQREQLYPEHCYRLAYGEADLLPGLIVDRYGDYFALQTTTVGMDCRMAMVLEALEEVLKPKGIISKNRGAFRSAEQLPEEQSVLFGEVPEQVELIENGCRFLAPLVDGQKTGWFYDHRENRAFMQRFCAAKSVLDVFSYVGGWGVQAAAAGASSVVCVDSSATALDLVQHNAELNGVADRVSSLQGKAADVLKALNKEQRRFEVIVLDPPAFIKRKKDQKQGEKAYHQMNELALKLLAPGGLLVSASCSMHLPAERLLNIVRSAGGTRSRRLQVLASLGQGPDHPIHPMIGETAYLKAIFARDLG
ncbi:MAG: class I SAM-dependent rRNA methyltransferase [Gammaproteobacteria bacterium]|nr:class I SAM-dependent rRNA methyltransferase [Gammaproteobacteria bacterium]MBQ0839189.1 class I SAM-dependent rRNA methyltransferase [Gammaproteobacteria bacterium]